MKKTISRMLMMGVIVMVFSMQLTGQVRSGKMMTIQTKPAESNFKPLDNLTVSIANATEGSIVVWDGKGVEYFRTPVQKTVTFNIGGALGGQSILLLDKKGVLIDKAGFDVDCKTQINDDKGFYAKFMKMLYNSMVGGSSQGGNEAHTNYVDGEFYNYFVCWLRDHVHTLKGMKYFYKGDIKSTIDLYSNYQREDGMIFDNIYNRKNETNYWDVSFSYGGFIKPVDNGNYELKRIPVEADVEYLFLEGLYYTWKATGDDMWMASHLDKALKALQYSTTSPYRWSEKYNLIKRGYTIDTWDFQNEEDSKISAGEGNVPHPMVVRPEYTRFSIMHGDNTGTAVGCRYLAEMLEYSGRKAEAEKVSAQGKMIMDNLNKIAWNGNFFTHHVPEDPTVKRDLGVDEKSQVSLSNAYNLNRGIDHDKAVQIIKTYQRIRQEMPKSSPGEFYGIYPPFTKGYGGHATVWEYVNGGVTGMVAGELAHGAFENGFEKYGVDIFQRLYQLSLRTNEYLHDTYRGSMPEDPARNFTILDLKNYANVDFDGTKGSKDVPAWTQEGENDFHNCPLGKQTYHDVPFEIIDPSKNSRKGCIGLSGSKGYKLNTVLPINQKAASIYFLHTLCIKSRAVSTNAGSIIINYTDNTKSVDVVDYQKITNWWYPSNAKMAKKAFAIPNAKATAVGASVYGLDNPYPEKTIKSIELQGIDIDSKWMVLGITLSDYPVYFKPDFISFGMPANWCAAAIVYAMVEGLAGVKDNGITYDKVLFSPRWAASDVKKVNTSVRYGASDGYVSYQYNATPSAIDILYTSNADVTEARILIPEGKGISSVMVNGKPIQYKNEMVQQSAYAAFKLNGRDAKAIVCNLK